MGQRRVDAITVTAIAAGAVALIVIFVGIHYMGFYIEPTGDAVLQRRTGRRIAGPSALVLLASGLAMFSRRYWVSGAIAVAAASVFVWLSYFSTGPPLTVGFVMRVWGWSLLFYPALLAAVSLEVAMKHRR